MNRSQAFEILKTYATVLRRVPLFNAALPQSLLRHDKDVIKRAIKVTMSFLEEDEPVISTLRDAYGSLAFFVPDEQAAVMARAKDAVQSDDANDADPELTCQTMRIKDKICHDQQTLEEEFRKFLETT